MTCGICHRETRDSAYVCDPCGDQYATDLKALVDSLDEELDATIAGTKGVDWSKGRTSGGGEPGLRVNWRAAALYRRLHLTLSLAVDHCIEARVRHTSTTEAAPARTIPAMASWLMWRVDGLCLDLAGPRHINDLSTNVARARAVLEWERPEMRFHGRCSICAEGYLYAEGEADEAFCDRCAAAFPAEARRLELLAELDDQLLRAVDIAVLSTYLGLRDNRDQVQRCISMWHHRSRVESRGTHKGDPTFRWGDVYPLLLERERRV